MERPMIRKLRCAVYTRKSTEEGLDMAFNSLDAQRGACHAYITASGRKAGSRFGTTTTMAASRAVILTAPPSSD